MKKAGMVFLCFLSLCHGISANEVKQTSSSTIPSSHLEKGIEQAIHYFLRKGANTRSYLTAFFYYLHRKFDISQLLVVAKQGESFYNDPVVPWTQKFLIRLTDPKRRIEQKYIDELPPSNKMLAIGLYCDDYGVPETYMGMLTAFAEVGWYGVTHSVISFQWVIENGCVPVIQDQRMREIQDRKLQELRTLQLRKMLEEIAVSEAKTDLGMEAIAFLYYSGNRASIKPEWIQTILNGQKSDGGWAHRQKEELSIDHPSLFGLWILLEAAHPERPAVPMIVKR